MVSQARGTVEAGVWNEATFSEVDGGPKLTTTSGVDHYHGDLECEATYAGITSYGTDGTASFLSVLRFVGTVGDRKGSFVLQLDGAVSGSGSTTATWEVQSGSGTGDLAGMRGTGGLTYGADGSSFTLGYAFD